MRSRTASSTGRPGANDGAAYSACRSPTATSGESSTYGRASISSVSAWSANRASDSSHGSPDQPSPSAGRSVASTVLVAVTVSAWCGDCTEKNATPLPK